MSIINSESRKRVATHISKILIENIPVLLDTTENFSMQTRQKTIRQGEVAVGRVNIDDKLLIYGNDFQAAAEDSHIIDQMIQIVGVYDSTTDTWSIDETEWGALTLDDWIYYNNNDGNPGILCVNYGSYDPLNDPIPGTGDIADSGLEFLFSDLEDLSLDNPQNISQYTEIKQKQDIIDLDKAKEILDLGITELIPNRKTRQEQIDDFFNMYLALRGNPPQFDVNDDGTIDGTDMSIFDSQEYADSHDHNRQNNPYEGYIVRLSDDNTNSFQTLQALRDDLNNFLKDVDMNIPSVIEDQRPEYQNKAGGYIKLRHLNQGIIIRKQEGDNIGIEDIVTKDNVTGPSYLVDGFTITMWVRFLDKVNRGTLFNYGNPTRLVDAKGFKLETFVLNKFDIRPSTIGSDDGEETWGEYAESVGAPTFAGNETARFIRLVVNEGFGPDGDLRDSHIGQSWQDRLDTVTNGIPELGDPNTEGLLLNEIQIPIDFSEWFFIVASYNPDINESNQNLNNPWYWLGYMNDVADTYVSSPSGWGARCKVEFISKSDLLRARGYRPEKI